MTEPLLSVRDLSVAFGHGARQTLAVDRVSFDVGKGEMTTAARQRDGDCASDSAGRSGDDCCAAFELQHDRATSRRSRESIVRRRAALAAIVDRC